MKRRNDMTRLGAIPRWRQLQLVGMYRVEKGAVKRGADMDCTELPLSVSSASARNPLDDPHWHHVGDEHEENGHDDAPRCRPTDSLGSARGIYTVVAAGRAGHEPEYHGLERRRHCLAQCHG